ncbi:MAG: gliding motility-associated C-terminal domain-containing protein, partial [Bacteroidota bacterium]|nr:gliding motility-associated C-terminal domain-containing protein [Bacteroidota bacterium]MDX5430662.1 gliding motility-associated C-terminal domain-containing protein [Bacteroidota bacterium]MDX5469409.1 gliding motility-associated C-terminal domain-containing protein [Bacteroidota bacterium]
KNESTLFEPVHRYYPDEGQFEVCLIASNPYGCLDTVCRLLDLSYPISVKVPNVFTPKSTDGLNDDFDIEIEGEILYELKIYNRFGQEVFTANADDENWNGLLKNGDLAPAGVYYVVFDYQFYYRDVVRYTGTLTLIR